jgi:glucose uptake protein GlcU
METRTIVVIVGTIIAIILIIIGIILVTQSNKTDVTDSKKTSLRIGASVCIIFGIGIIFVLIRYYAFAWRTIDVSDED